MLTTPNHPPILNMLYFQGKYYFQRNLLLEWFYTSLCLESWHNVSLPQVFCRTVNTYSITKSLLDLINSVLHSSHLEEWKDQSFSSHVIWVSTELRSKKNLQQSSPENNYIFSSHLLVDKGKSECLLLCKKNPERPHHLSLLEKARRKEQ